MTQRGAHNQHFNVPNDMYRHLLAYSLWLFLIATSMVIPAAAQPIISGPSGAGAVDLGQPVLLRVSVTYGTPPFTYQWRKNGASISGATSASYAIAAATAGDAGTYGVIVNDATGSTSSSNVDLVINPPAAPVVTLSPANRTITQGQSTNFTVYATGSYPRTYQWYKDGTAILDGTASTYGLQAVALADAGSYSVTITNSYGSASSAAATLTVTPASPPDIPSSSPYDVSVTEGSYASFSVYLSSGSSPYTYQWRKNGVNISGATDSSYSISQTAISDAGTYSVVVLTLLVPPPVVMRS